MSIISLEDKRQERDGHHYRRVCSCGNCTYELRQDGSILCASCDAPIEDAREWWAPEDPDALPWRVSRDSPDVLKSMTPNLAEKRAKAKAATPAVSWLIYGDDEGSISAWSRNAYDTRRRQKWLRAKIRWALGILLSPIDSGG